MFRLKADLIELAGESRPNPSLLCSFALLIWNQASIKGPW